MRRVLGVMIAGAMLAGCNSSNGNGVPTGPGGYTAITVNSSSDFMPRGAVETFSATATTTSGSTQAVVTGEWGTDAPAILQITPAGQATALTTGLATVYVDFAGLRGTKLIRVLPNFAGQYFGSYEVTNCTTSDDWTSTTACDSDPMVGIFPPGSLRPLAFLLSQAGATLTGQTALGAVVSGPFTASIREDGGVTVDAVANFTDEMLGPLVVTETWELRADQPGQLTGTLHVVLTGANLTGSTIADGTIATASTTPAGSSSQRRPMLRLDSAAAALRYRFR